MNEDLRAALILTYKGQIAAAHANIQVYLRHPAGIGDHSNIVAAIDEQVEIASNSQEKLDWISCLEY